MIDLSHLIELANSWERLKKKKKKLIKFEIQLHFISSKWLVFKKNEECIYVYILYRYTYIIYMYVFMYTHTHTHTHIVWWWYSLICLFFFWNLLVLHNAGTYNFERDLFPKMTSYQSRGQNSKLRLTNIHFVAGT